MIQMLKFKYKPKLILLYYIDRCLLIVEFCTPWPAGLETDELCDEHFPVKITTTQYLVDGPSVRDSRARVVTLKVGMTRQTWDS